MAKALISNAELKTGNYAGQDAQRTGKEPDGVRYFSKCHFGIYYVCDITGKKGTHVTAVEKLRTIRNSRQAVLTIAKAYPETVGQCATLLKCLLFAEAELQSYSPNDIICGRLVERTEIKSRISALRQRVRTKYGNSVF